MKKQDKLEDKIILYECFKKYLESYKDNYCKDKYLPQNLIEFYYEATDDVNFDLLKKSFMKKYIYNENEVEAAHTSWERRGLREMYNFIHGYDTSRMDIYTILELHEQLYKYAPNKDFGGHFRNSDAHINNSMANLMEWSCIRYEIIKLKSYTKELIQRGKELNGTSDFDELFKYIEECVILNTDLLKIHPFYDGNGRCIRGFTNMLFELANIPPIYVPAEEKEKYKSAIRKTDEDIYKDIIIFYYYKICDSIIDLQYSRVKKEKDRALKLLKSEKNED